MSVDVTINRDKYIGGSDLPAILGLNKQFGKSIIQFAKEKLKIVPKIKVITITTIGATLKNTHSNECHIVPITLHSGLL